MCSGCLIILIVIVGRDIDACQRRLWLSHAVVSHQGWGVTKPPPSITLSTAEGEALIERVEGSGLSAEDRRVVVQVIRLYFWLMVALQDKPRQHILYASGHLSRPEFSGENFRLERHIFPPNMGHILPSVMFGEK